MSTDKKYTNEETLEAIRQKANADGDSFTVRVGRVEPTKMLPTHIALLSGATVSHIASSVRWLQPLFGGGDFSLTVFHTLDRNETPIGGSFKISVEGDRQDRPVSSMNTIMKGKSYFGPNQLLFPVDTGPTVPDRVVYSAGNGNVAVSSMPSSVVSPPVQMPQVPFQASEAYRALQEQRDQVEQEKRELAARAHQMELEKVRAEAANRAAETEKQLRELRDDLRRPQAEPKADTAGMITAIGTLVANLVAPIVSAITSAADKRAQAEASAAQAAREASNLQFQFLAKLAEPKSDPALAVLAAKVESLASAKPTDLLGVAEAMSTMMTAQVTTLQAATEMLNPQENPVIQAIRESGKALATVAEGFAPKRRQLAANGAGQAVQPTQAQAFAGVQPNQAQPTNNSFIAEIIRQIKLNASPTVIASHVIAAVKGADPRYSQAHQEIHAELQKLGEDAELTDLFQAHLGEWMKASTENVAYALQLGQECERIGLAEGVYEKDDGSEVEGQVVKN